MKTIHPSLLGADPLELGNSIEMCIALGLTHFHIDIMDLHYVPYLALNIDTVIALHKRYPQCHFDLHLMSNQVPTILKQCQNIPIHCVYLHPETILDTDRVHKTIRDLGALLGICLNPHEPLTILTESKTHYDSALIMGVTPGRCGQKMHTQTPQRIRILREHPHTKHLLLGVDGGVNTKTLAEYPAMLFDFCVAGSALFANDSLQKNIELFQKALKDYQS